MSFMSSQPRLFRREGDLSSVRRPYVPILLAKQGERIGLGHIDASVRDLITPYLRIVPPELRGKDADAAPPEEIGRLARLLGDQVAYLDAVGAPRRDRRAAPLGAAYVRDIYDAAEAADMAYMPVYPYGRTDIASTVASFASESLGAAVLLRSDAVMPRRGGRLRDQLREEVRSVGIEPGRLDGVVDLGYLADGADDPASAIWLVREVAAAVPWRTLILAGTSIPDSVAREIPDDSLNGIERREHALFAAVQAGVSEPLRFADYGIQHPVPPTPNPVPQMRASIRYTAGPFTYVSRGGRPLGEIPSDDRPFEYQEVAARLRDHPQFAVGACCWADQFIDELADGRRVARGQHSMRAVATCHHVTVVAAERSGGPQIPGPAGRRRETVHSSVPTSS
jgi:hypothetical protein